MPTCDPIAVPSAAGANQRSAGSARRTAALTLALNLVLNLALGVALLPLAGTAQAAGPITVPHTFSSGTPARAAEVNANFQALATGINELGAAAMGFAGAWRSGSAYPLNAVVTYGGGAYVAVATVPAGVSSTPDVDAARWSRLAAPPAVAGGGTGGGSGGSGSGSTTGTACAPPSLRNYRWSGTGAAVGSQVNVGGRLYTVYRLPLLEIGSGVRYAVTLPVLPTSEMGQNLKQVSFSTEHDPADSAGIGACTTTLSGFPAVVQVSDGISYSAFQNSYLSPTYGTWTVSGEARISAQIRVGATRVSIGLTFANPAAYVKSTADYATSDFTAGFAWDRLTPLPDAWLDAAGQLMNLVSISRLP